MLGLDVFEYLQEANCGGRRQPAGCHPIDQQSLANEDHLAWAHMTFGHLQFGFVAHETL